ncbi:putative DsDNA-dependent ATPase [Taphrina deformans PYCC 5710]|uniref:DsDNA-dependent ATPase n=1 Tax=Taphrina deformans (strain PYCC 5710 / ATCC 11124 / CBS 356.35 / IMI 108563 / JCM 9778 / NBRC 8474) TaxID=1097556 RepID=R4XFE2_TAPDE|nr:putative DsDNA-dependent ATPase [Taphrina deformans PYCC 5710]|eukprot:CCG83171.1 putative DsDNA-dependent ATPase [Taphrina deformans PYCC 5710]
MSAKEIGKGRHKCEAISVGDVLSVGGKECEIEATIEPADYLCGSVFLKTGKVVPATPYTSSKSHVRVPFKNPLLDENIQGKTEGPALTPEARHNPAAPNALVLTRPSDTKSVESGRLMDVVVDPFIGQFLRPHQREGVSFLYDCIMRFKDYNGAGAILADEMGLGKTLQTIALIWTLLKQHFLVDAGALAKKILIVCPVTLTNNWKKEFRKWLGQDRVGVFVVDSKANLRDFLYGKVYQVMIIGYEKLRLVQETDELKNANFDVIICDEGHKLKSANNKAAQAIKSLKTTRRIVLSGTPIQNDLGEFYVMIDFVNPGLLGTYATFKKEFENPILKARSPDATKKDKEKGAARSAELSRLTDLFILRRTSDLLSGYLPAKTEYVVFCKPTALQIKLHEQLLSMPAAKQCLGGQNAAFQLCGITHLRKISNSPGLLSDTVSERTKSSSTLTSPYYQEDDSFLASVQQLARATSASKQSGKLLVLERFLGALRHTKEKIVIVSQFTQTLQILQGLLDSMSLTYCRLDGGTATSKRQSMVESFNRSPASTCFAFLLSAKSGGCGLNLIGASRLVLFDSDWNPSVDLQAMARVHRDGQKRPVFIYRFLTTGMIDEKIYQRQVTKQGLSDSLMDLKSAGSSFSLEELRDLFRCHKDTDCLTHDMLLCHCKHDGQNQVDCNEEDVAEKSSDCDDEDVPVSWMKASQVQQEDIEKTPKQTNMKALRIYNHVGSSLLQNDPDQFEAVVGDDILTTVVRGNSATHGHVSYTFVKKSGLAPSLPEPENVADGLIEEEPDLEL